MNQEKTATLSEEEFNKYRIRNSDVRLLWYKAQLAEIGQNKKGWPPQEPSTIEYKEMIRGQKNTEEHYLKCVREEQRWLRQSLNPLMCYPVVLRELDGIRLDAPS